MAGLHYIDRKKVGMSNKVYVCKRMRLLSWLTERGFRPFCTRTDIYDPRYLVWMFDDSKELQDAVADYYNQPCFVMNKTR